jgi:flagellar hook assembly protein FlgD
VYPNPFNPVTNIHYELAEDGKVLLEIYNIKGQKVETLINDAVKAGKHDVAWNAEKRGSGIYLLHFTSAGFEEVKKIILLK